MKVTIRFDEFISVRSDYDGRTTVPLLVEGDIGLPSILGILIQASEEGILGAENLIPLIEKKELIEWAESQGLHY